MMNFQLKKFVERELIDYERTKKLIEQEIKELEIDVVFGKEQEDATGIRTSGIKNPTAKKAIDLINKKSSLWIKAAEQRIKAIDRAIARMSDEQKELIRLKYWTSPQTLTNAGIALRMNVDERTVRRWSKNIVALIAVEMNLL